MHQAILAYPPILLIFVLHLVFLQNFMPTTCLKFVLDVLMHVFLNCVVIKLICLMFHLYLMHSHTCNIIYKCKHIFHVERCRDGIVKSEFKHSQSKPHALLNLQKRRIIPPPPKKSNMFVHLYSEKDGASLHE